MKNLAIFFLGCLLIFSCSSKKYKIVAKIDNIPDSAKVYLFDNESRTDIDSAIVLDGNFQFTGSVPGVTLYYIVYKPAAQRGTYLPVWVENKKIIINGDIEKFGNAIVTGSDVQTQQEAVNKLLEPIDIRIDSIYKVYNENDSVAAQFLSNLYDTLQQQEIKEKLKYVESNPGNFYSVYLLSNLIREVSPDKGQKLYVALDENQKDSKYGRAVKKYLDLNKNLKVGDHFVDFALMNANNSMESLSTVANGKYTLIDFWASWCSPCRAENPTNVKAYNMYKKDGFEIFGVSLDKNINSWQHALAVDGISWPSVIDTLGFDGDAAMMYSAKYIPHNFLLNPDGNIIAIDLKGKDLQDKLKEIFDK